MWSGRRIKQNCLKGWLPPIWLRMRRCYRKGARPSSKPDPMDRVAVYSVEARTNRDWSESVTAAKCVLSKCQAGLQDHIAGQACHAEQNHAVPTGCSDCSETCTPADVSGLPNTVQSTRTLPGRSRRKVDRIGIKRSVKLNAAVTVRHVTMNCDSRCHHRRCDCKGSCPPALVNRPCHNFLEPPMSGGD